jgi:hypothetical protein
VLDGPTRCPRKRWRHRAGPARFGVTGRRGRTTEVARLAGGGARLPGRCFGTGPGSRARSSCRPRSGWPRGRSTAGLRSRSAQVRQATGVYRPARGAEVRANDPLRWIGGTGIGSRRRLRERRNLRGHRLRSGSGGRHCTSVQGRPRRERRGHPRPAGRNSTLHRPVFRHRPVERAGSLATRESEGTDRTGHEGFGPRVGSGPDKGRGFRPPHPVWPGRT